MCIFSTMETCRFVLTGTREGDASASGPTHNSRNWCLKPGGPSSSNSDVPEHQRNRTASKSTPLPQFHHRKSYGGTRPDSVQGKWVDTVSLAASSQVKLDSCAMCGGLAVMNVTSGTCQAKAGACCGSTKASCIPCLLPSTTTHH